MKRFPEIARRAAALALAASMSLSVLAPCASAAVTARDLENSVDELGNVDLTDEVFNVPDDTAAKPEIRETAEEPEFPAVEDDGVADDLTEEQLAEQAVVDEAGHEEHTPDTDAEPVYEQPATCAERGYAIYPCSFTLEQEDGTVAHCYHQVVVWLPLADHEWGEWQEPDDADSQKYRVCTVCNAVEYEDGTVVTPGGIPVTDPDHPEWLPGDDSEIAAYSLLDDLKDAAFKTAEELIRKEEQKIIDKDHPHDHVKGELVATVDATCTKEGYKEYQCNKQFQHTITVTVKNPLPFGKKEYTYSKNITLTCKKKPKETIKALEHDFPDEDDPNNWVVTKPAICEKDGVETLTCTRCNGKEDGGIKTRAIPHGNVKHQWVKIDSVAATCEEEGYDLYECSVCKTTKKEKTAEKLGHLFTNYVDDGKPACQQQTATRKCKREGCTGAEQKNLPNFGADDKPLAHRYTRWDTKMDGLSYVKYAKCDYCGAEYTEKIDGWGDITSGGTEQVAKLAADAVKADIKNAITQTLQTTAANVNAAQTKEEAITALLNFKDAAADALVENFKIKIKGDVVAQLSKKDALKIINDAIPDLDSIGKSLNDSFLSKDTIQAIVDKMANVVSSAEIQQAMEDAAYDLVYQAAYSYIDGGLDTKKIKVDDMLQVKNLVAKLVSATVASDYGWDKLTKAIVKDAVELGVGKLKEKEKYAKLLKTNLGVETLKEVEDAINQQLVNDPTFMKQVRDLLKNAANNASSGISRGWSDERVLTDLRTDVMPVTELVANKISELGGTASDIADKKVNDTVKKYLPGKLGDWVSDKLGGYIKGQVQNEVDGVGEDVNDLITSYIKYLTCPRHHEATRTVQAQTCTTPKKTETYCTECDWVFKKEETAPALGHDPVTVPGVEPTETADGLTDGIQCARCGAWLEPQKVRPALNPEYDKWYVKADITAETVKAAGYQSKQKLDEAIDNALKKAGFEPADSERFLAQVQTNLDVLKDEYDREPGEGASRILTNDRYPEEGVTGMVKFPAKAPGKDGTYYAVQVITADNHGYSAGDVIVTPLTVTKEGISFQTGVQAVVAIAWKPNN